MISRELKINLKSLIIWTTVIILIFTLVFSIYPSIMDNSTETSLNEIIQVMPESFLTAFNIDVVNMTSVTGFLSSEGMVLLMIIYGIYASQLGSSILLKEESEKTIEFLYSKPISKKRILTNKLIAGLINVFAIHLLISIFLIIGLTLSNEPIKEILLLNISLLMPSILLYLISLLISTFFTKTKQTSAISYAIVLVSYFLLTFGNISEKVEFLKLFSVYSLADTRNQVANNTFNNWYIIIFIIIAITTIIMTYKKYTNKEFAN